MQGKQANQTKEPGQNVLQGAKTHTVYSIKKNTEWESKNPPEQTNLNMQQDLYPSFKKNNIWETSLPARPTDRSSNRRTQRLDRRSSISPIQ